MKYKYWMWTVSAVVVWVTVVVPVFADTLVNELRQELAEIKNAIRAAEEEDSKLKGGLVKALIRVRLELLRTNAALIQQRIHAEESGAKVSMQVNVSKPDSQRAAALNEELKSLSKKITELDTEIEKYRGGLVLATLLSTRATVLNTYAMVQTEYLKAKYGIHWPPRPGDIESSPKNIPAAATVDSKSQGQSSSEKCLEIVDYDSSVLSSNKVFIELSWRADVKNNCPKPFDITVTFKIFDKDDFILDEDRVDIVVPANGTGKARDKMLVSPPEKARRMIKQGVSISVR